MDLDALYLTLERGDEGKRLLAVSQATTEPFDAAVWQAMVRHLPEESSQAVREAIVFGLQHMPCADVYSDIFALFHADDAYLRNAAMDIFGNGSDVTVKFLMEQVLISDREVRKLILDSLVQIGTPNALKGIRTALYDPAPNVRITAADYLGRLNDTQSVDVMLDMFANDKEPMLRTTILESVASMSDPAAMRKLIDFQQNVGLDEQDETLFLPILLRFAGRAGNTEYLAGLLARIRSLPLYAQDVIQAFQNISDTNVGNYPRSIVLFEALKGIAQDVSIREDLRFSALTILTRLGRPFEVPDLAAFSATFQEEDFRAELGEFCKEV